MSGSAARDERRLSLARRAELTPHDRNRVVDLFRGGALVVIVLGHWLMAGVFVDGEGELHRTGLLGVAPWTHPLTWLFQVIPVLMLVGG